MSTPSQEATKELIAKKRAEVLARMAKMGIPTSANASSVRPPPAIVAAAPAPAVSNTSSLHASIAATRARIEARMKAQGLGSASSNSSSTKPTALPTELHPMLSSDIKPTRGVPLPRVSSIKANQRVQPQPKRMKIEHEVPAAFVDPQKNPYFDPHLGGQRSAMPKQRRHAKKFQFARPGRFIEQADRVRAEQKVEKLKAEIAERAEKARLEDEVLDMTAIRPPEPPAVEWWDAPLLSADSYTGSTYKIEGTDSPITIYVQHPVPIEPPQSILASGSAPSQLILTKKERKKIRRQRREEQQRDHRDKVMVGLLPPDPPKVKLANFMRILANQSVPDPTRLEAEVRKQVEARQIKHQEDNKARQLTKEQRHAKWDARLQAEEDKGLVSAVFRVKKLSHAQHKFKVVVNAREWKMTGIAVVCPQMSVVIVEGSGKAVKAYKKLMLRRIDWTDSQPTLETSEDKQLPVTGDPDAEPVDYSDNECYLIWQGSIDVRRFSQFNMRTCATESGAKNWLAQAGAESFWQLAMQFDPHDGITLLNTLV
ncbi:U4/U5/U6 small nuclear ribonucleoprotein prp3 [Linderina macrospora]|uniref:U4/U5/U6 small nuclear ribonucleoprotein prp3 n=1 Tax=Linderina macrospora TaxID=4868 RepID=A0ACC1JH07_9FUNG|nr:U4/U5/U6 small nuclear ribonucleoprotein prp3 [Linderina macrospora]